MKFLVISIFSLISLPLIAKEINPFEDSYTIRESIKNSDKSSDIKVTYLIKLLERQQTIYDNKIVFLEKELNKTKNRLLEKSINQEKFEEAIKEKYNTEAVFLKKELAHTTKSLMDAQRQIEKMNPSEDLKNMIKLNTDLASEIRRREDQIASIQLQGRQSISATNPAPTRNMRMPASVIQEK